MKIHSLSHVKDKSRATGFDCPWSLLQVITYILLLFTIINFLVKIVPGYQGNKRIILILIFSILLSLFCYFGFRLTRSNPTDNSVLHYRKQVSEKIPQSISIINKIWCESCKSIISNNNTKHCSMCNRCVSNFDHHCKFVNNCVGDKNYRIFIKLIIFLEVFSFFIVFVSLDFAWKVRVGPENLSVYLQVLTCGIILALNGMLIGFHVFLNCKKLTTFGYFERKTEFRANEQVELGHGKDLVNK